MPDFILSWSDMITPRVSGVQPGTHWRFNDDGWS